MYNLVLISWHDFCYSISIGEIKRMIVDLLSLTKELPYFSDSFFEKLYNGLDETMGGIDKSLNKDETAYIYTLSLPGISKEDISIKVYEEKNYDLLTIKILKDSQYVYKKIFNVILPEDSDISNITSSLKNGILTIMVPRKEKEYKNIVINE